MLFISHKKYVRWVRMTEVHSAHKTVLHALPLVCRTSEPRVKGPAVEAAVRCLHSTGELLHGTACRVITIRG